MVGQLVRNKGRCAGWWCVVDVQLNNGNVLWSGSEVCECERKYKCKQKQNVKWLYLIDRCKKTTIERRLTTANTMNIQHNGGTYRETQQWGQTKLPSEHGCWTRRRLKVRFQMACFVFSLVYSSRCLTSNPSGSNRNRAEPGLGVLVKGARIRSTSWLGDANWSVSFGTGRIRQMP